MKKLYIIPVCALALMCSCKEKNMEVRGEIAGADNQSVVLEKSDYSGVWIALDSARTSSAGKFSISTPAAAAPEIYRLVLNGKYIYIPVDSTETITVTTTAKDFGHEFTLSGSTQAEQMAAFEKALMRANLSNPDSADSFKRSVYTNYIKDSHGSMLSYYLLTKTLPDGTPLFDAADPGDARYFAAVATQFNEFRPDDPHGALLKKVSLDAMRNRNSAQGKKTVITAQALSVIDIALTNEDNKTVKLSDIAGKGKPTLVVFAMMNSEDSPAFNRELANVNRTHPELAIYHISFDEDHYAWRDAARNLPWTTVIDAGGLSSNALRDYNVSSLPTFFIYDSTGELQDRAESISELNKLLSSKKY
jgi:hypothetical protein